MLTFEDCLGLCELTEDEVRAIAEHERLTEVAALELGDYLMHAPDGEQCIRAMILDDIAAAPRARALALRLVLRNFVLQHPRCDHRHRQQLHLPERRRNAA
jgi:hypothetical protein